MQEVTFRYHVGARGYLAKDNDNENDNENGGNDTKNGNGNGNNTNNNGNGNGNSNGVLMAEGLVKAPQVVQRIQVKDGKGDKWVNVVTGGTCASDEPGEGTPKCVSSAKRGLKQVRQRLSKRRKKAADPGQQQKTGAAKPTYVSTDKKKMKKEVEIIEAKDKKGKGSGTKDACYHKVKSRYSVWASAYASRALISVVRLVHH